MSREAFRNRRVHPVQVNGETFHVKPLTGAQIETFMSSESGDEPLDGINALSRVCCYCACDENGARTFSDSDIEYLRTEADFSVVKAVAEAAMKHSGLGDDSGN